MSYSYNKYSYFAFKFVSKPLLYQTHRLLVSKQFNQINLLTFLLLFSISDFTRGLSLLQHVGQFKTLVQLERSGSFQSLYRACYYISLSAWP